jgi:hypothetical protein
MEGGGRGMDGLLFPPFPRSPVFVFFRFPVLSPGRPFPDLFFGITFENIFYAFIFNDLRAFSPV